jgi:hypothetical protein
MTVHLEYTSALKIETVCSSKTLVPTYESIWRHNPEDEHRHNYFYFAVFEDRVQ